MLAAFPTTSPVHDLFQRLFNEQYVAKDGKAVLRDKKEIKADSLQNPILMQPTVARTTRRCKAM